MQPAGSSAPVRGTGVFMPRHSNYLSSSPVQEKTDAFASADSSTTVERSAQSAGVLTGCSSTRHSSTCSNLRFNTRKHISTLGAETSDPSTAVPAHCTRNHQMSRSTSGGVSDSHLPRVRHSLTAQLPGFTELDPARETNSTGLPKAPSGACPIPIPRGRPTLQPSPRGAVDILNSSSSYGGETPVFSFGSLPGGSPPPPPPPPPAAAAAAAGASSHTSMRSNQAYLPPFRAGNIETPAAAAAACRRPTGGGVEAPLTVGSLQWSQFPRSTWSDTCLHTLSRVSSAPVMGALPGAVPLSQGPQLLPQPHMHAAPAAPFGSEEVLFALQQQLAAAGSGPDNSAAAGGEGMLLGWNGAKAVPHSFVDIPSAVLEQQLQAPCKSPAGPLSYGSLQLGSSPDSCSAPFISTVPTGGALEVHLAPAAAAAPDSSSLKGDSIWGSSIPRSLSHNVSGMAVAVAQHKLEQIAALEVLQQQLQQDVADLLPLL